MVNCLGSSGGGPAGYRAGDPVRPQADGLPAEQNISGARPRPGLRCRGGRAALQPQHENRQHQGSSKIVAGKPGPKLKQG